MGQGSSKPKDKDKKLEDCSHEDDYDDDRELASPGRGGRRGRQDRPAPPAA